MSDSEPLVFRFIEGFIMNILVLLAFALLLAAMVVGWFKDLWRSDG